MAHIWCHTMIYDIQALKVAMDDFIMKTIIQSPVAQGMYVLSLMYSIGGRKCEEVPKRRSKN